MNQIPDDTRAQLASFLPGALERALTSYREFFDREDDTVDDDGKVIKIKIDNFKARHAAAKIALAHVELLLKLHKDLVVAAQSEDDDGQIINLEQALKEIEGQKEEV